MKKTAFITLVCIIGMFLISCGDISDDKIEYDDMNVQFDTGIYFDKNWDELDLTYEEDVIPNEEVALNVAIQIFEGMSKDFGESEHYIPQNVFFDEQDEIWIVSFWPDWPEDENSVYVGECCSIALQKKDGKVLRIWYGE